MKSKDVKMAVVNGKSVWLKKYIPPEQRHIPYANKLSNCNRNTYVRKSWIL